MKEKFWDGLLVAVPYIATYSLMVPASIVPHKNIATKGLIQMFKYEIYCWWLDESWHSLLLTVCLYYHCFKLACTNSWICRMVWQTSLHGSGILVEFSPRKIELSWVMLYLATTHTTPKCLLLCHTCLWLVACSSVPHWSAIWLIRSRALFCLSVKFWLT